jgi:hypothetical protein
LFSARVHRSNATQSIILTRWQIQEEEIVVLTKELDTYKLRQLEVKENETKQAVLKLETLQKAMQQLSERSTTGRAWTRAPAYLTSKPRTAGSEAGTLKRPTSSGC